MFVVGLKYIDMPIKQILVAVLHLKVVQVRCFHSTLSCVYEYISV